VKIKGEEKGKGGESGAGHVKEFLVGVRTG